MKQFEINDANYIQHQKKEQKYFRIVAATIQEVESIQKFFPSVSYVQLSKDNSVLKIFVTFEKNSKDALMALDKAKGFVRTILAKSINAKHAPVLVFEIDKVIEKGNRIDEILKKLNEENNK